MTSLLPLQMEATANEAIKQAARLVQERERAASDADGRIKELQGHLQRLQAQQSELSGSAALLAGYVSGCRVALNVHRMRCGSELSTPVAPSFAQFPLPNACLWLLLAC